jgi:DNA processing protein
MTVTLARNLLERIGSERDFFDAPESQLRYITSSRAKIYTTASRQATLEAACREREFLQRGNVTPLYFTDEDYPQRLLQCEDAPAMLYAAGETDLNACRPLAIVGTRHATPYGLDFVNRLVADLAEMTDSVAIVSGLAYGIDVAAHRAALRHGLPTIGVMATGLNTIYPADHRAVAVDMARHGGMLLTEYTTAEPIHKGNFVARNRIVAGMCDCLVVAESAEHGGALITASLAAQYSRDVFALPGRVSDRYSSGCNRLIASTTAQLITSAADLCEAMSWPMRQKASAEAATAAQPELPLLTADEERVIAHLESSGGSSISAIIAATGMAITPLMSMLIDLEFRGLLLALPGGIYRKV